MSYRTAKHMVDLEIYIQHLKDDLDCEVEKNDTLTAENQKLKQEIEKLKAGNQGPRVAASEVEMLVSRLDVKSTRMFKLSWIV